MKFVIDVSKWRCGGDKGEFILGKGYTQLLNKEGYMCCLGQIEEQLGVPEHNLLHGEPYETQVENILCKLDNDPDEFYDTMYSNTDLSDRAMTINDDSKIDTQTRKQKLIELFAEYGHELEFING